jgi:anti-anti-sigma factor
VPLELHRRAAEHNATVVRELALVRAGVEADAGERLRALSEDIDVRFGVFTASQRASLLEASERGEGAIDLDYRVPPAVADAAEHLGDLLDEIDSLCQAGELVTLSTPPDELAYRRWLLGEFIGQIRDGRAPRPWPGHPGQANDVADSADPAPSGPPLVSDGDLDLLGAPSLRAAIAERLEAGETTLVIDLSRSSFIDSVGLSLLLTTRERCVAAGGSLSVIGADEAALRLFETVGVKELLLRS